MADRTFSPASFYADVGASPKERNALRQDLVRGLKDYFESVYGYDRYGAETIFHVPERLHEPYIYGFAALRVLNDRRIRVETKVNAARRALTSIDYGTDHGLPFGLFGILYFLDRHGQLSSDDVRYGLLVSAGEYLPFRGLEKPDVIAFFDSLMSNADLPESERLFWGHSLIARHQDQPGAPELVDSLLGCPSLPTDGRAELCRAWIYFRQPRLLVDIPESKGDARSSFVAEHTGFWLAHSPSWPSLTMVRRGLVWLARLTGEAGTLATTYISYQDKCAEQMHLAVAEILEENWRTMPEAQVRSIIESGLSVTGSISARRRLYRLGIEVFGAHYLQRATEDRANSVRQWATRQLQKQT